MEKWLQAGFSPLFVVLAGNTVMDHLLLHMDVSGLSHAPFTPVTTGQVVTDIAMLKCYVMPGISAFVGGDIMAGADAEREGRESTFDRSGNKRRDGTDRQG